MHKNQDKKRNTAQNEALINGTNLNSSCRNCGKIEYIRIW